MKLGSSHIFIIAIIIALLFSLSFFAQDYFQNLIESLNAYTREHSVYGAFIFISLAAASVMLGPFTSAPLTTIAVEVWDTGLTLVLLLGGWLIGNTLAYLIGRYLGYPLVSHMVKTEKLEEWTDYLREKADVKLLFLFRLATPSETGYVFGLFKYNIIKYLAITLLAELPFALIIVYAGEAITENAWWKLAALSVIGIALLLLALHLLRISEKDGRY